VTTFYNALTALATCGVTDSLLPSGKPAINNGGLVALLIDGLDNWFQQSTVNPALIDECFHLLLEEQAHLGWRQIFDGRWSFKWAYLQDQYLREIGNEDPKYIGTTWRLTAMLATVWQQFFALWSERNATIATRQAVLCRKITAKSTNGSTAGGTNCSNPASLTFLSN
jgi:hypothetical protein